MKRAKQRLSVLLAFVLAVQLFRPAFALAADFTPNPQTPYAKQFIQDCESQQWFIDELERLLNSEQKTLDTISSAADFSNIKSLGFRNRGIAGSIPKAVGELTELRYLFLSGNHLSGTIPVSLFALPALENVDLSENAYSGSIPAAFGSMVSLRHLDLHKNQFTGTIPSEILSNTALVYLDVSGNKLSGPLPAALNDMTGLQYLAVSDNSWTAGALPDLSGLTALKTLSAWGCRLTGELPASLYGMTTLQVLDLDSNALCGEISGNIANLKQLQLLSLANNRLRGVVPDALGALPRLSTLDISNNCLRGKLPAGASDYDAVYAQNNYMTGEVLRDLENNSGNFADAASTAQYQLSASRDPLQITQSGTVNVYALLQNRPVNGGGAVKQLLNPDEYAVTCDAGKAEITVDAHGIYVKALTEIPRSAQEPITIMIRDNTGSDYSKVTFHLTTEAADVPSGGGGGGGGGAATPGQDYHNRYINGFPDGGFRANENVTREQTAKMLIDAMRKETVSAAAASYMDVPESRWSFAWIEAATEEGYMQGYGEGVFGPAKPITRAEMATVLVRIAAKEGLPMSGSSKTFPDVAEGKWYADYVRQAVRYGLINGYEDGTFRPEQPVTRAETVAMINRMLSRDYKTAAQLHSMQCPFSDVVTAHWAYGDIMEASISHSH